MCQYISCNIIVDRTVQCTSIKLADDEETFHRPVQNACLYDALKRVTQQYYMSRNEVHHQLRLACI